MCAHAPCVRQRYDLGPTPLCGLGGERLGRSVAISINCPASPESPKGPQEAAYTPKAISNRLGKGVDSSLTNGSRLYTCESKYRQAYTLRTERYDKSNAELPMTPNLPPLTDFVMWPSSDYVLVP